MSEADNMFEKLGYKTMIKTMEKGELINTKYIQENKIGEDYLISFNEITKEVVLSGFRSIEMEELQAINEKVKELGWYE